MRNFLIMSACCLLLAFSVFSDEVEKNGPHASSIIDALGITVVELPAYHIGYVRTVGAYGRPDIIGPAFETVVGWAMSNGLMDEKSLVIGIGWDDPEMTPLEECRYDAAVTVPADAEGNDLVSISALPGGLYAIYSFTGKYENIGEEIGAAWATAVSWMEANEYEYDMRPPLEIYKETMEQMETGIYVLDLCVPVKEK